jgi:hypothetical protein
MTQDIFNPLKWGKEQMISFIINALLSSSLGIIIGYVMYVLPQGAEGGVSFKYWFWDLSWFWWAFFGIIYAYLNFLSKKLAKVDQNNA